MGKRSKYNEKDKEYALSVLERFNGSYKHAAAFLNEEGKVSVTYRTLQNWSNEQAARIDTAEASCEVLQAQVENLKEASIIEIRSEAAKGLEAVVDQLNERLVDDRFNKMLTSYELVNIGNFFASISGKDKPEQTESGKLNIYQQIINQSYKT